MNNLGTFVHLLHGKKLEFVKVSIGHGTIGSSRKQSESWICSKSRPYVWRKTVSIPDSRLVSGTSVKMSIDKLDLDERLLLLA